LPFSAGPATSRQFISQLISSSARADVCLAVAECAAALVDCPLGGDTNASSPLIYHLSRLFLNDGPGFGLGTNGFGTHEERGLAGLPPWGPYRAFYLGLKQGLGTNGVWVWLTIYPEGSRGLGYTHG